MKLAEALTKAEVVFESEGKHYACWQDDVDLTPMILKAERLYNSAPLPASKM